MALQSPVAWPASVPLTSEDPGGVRAVSRSALTVRLTATPISARTENLIRGGDGGRGPALREATSPSAETPGDADDGNNNNNNPSRTDLSGAPGKSITCQPQARPTATRPPPTGSPEWTATPRNGRKPGPRPPLLRAASSSSSSALAPPHRGPKTLQSNPSLASQRSKGSSKSNGSQIPTEAQDDCCVHCILACLFCEFLTLCNIVLDCATCGSCTSDDSCFCCCCASEECGDCDLPCDMDCGIIDACCESADCLEICMECCGLCFSS
ncbi:myoD family inhibitor [Electrophorus electricus]|uniref:myoD family inhibitor n=1 Tax=Electrophorus electricus TaxID=8005 RepID=UPI0015CFE528|nr:myoD family inhibitor [Electrophorus electricus]